MILLHQRMRVLAVMALLIPATSQGSEPQALSIAPLGGQLGARLEARLRGQSLQGAYAVRFDREGVTATIERVEEPTSSWKPAARANRRKNRPRFRS